MKKFFEKGGTLKIFSFVAAVVLWMVVMGIENPEKDVSFSSVEVEISGLDTISAESGLSLIGGGQEHIVSIRVRGRSNVLASLSPGDIVASVDVSAVSRSGVFSFPVTVDISKRDVTLVGITPSVLSLRLDKIVTTEVPIKIDINGSFAEGRVLGSAVATPAFVRIRGPVADVNYVSYARVEVNENGMETSFSLTQNVKLYNEQGEEVQNSYITILDKSVEVSIEIFLKKTVPLSISLVNPLPVTEQYYEYTLSQSAVAVAGTQMGLSSLSSVRLESIDCSQLKSGTTAAFTRQVSLPPDLVNVDNVKSVEIEVKSINPSSKTIFISSPKIINAPDGFDIRIEGDGISVNVAGRADAVFAARASDIEATIDLSAVAFDGENAAQAPVTVRLKSDVDGFGVVGTYSVLIKGTSRLVETTF